MNDDFVDLEKELDENIIDMLRVLEDDLRVKSNIYSNQKKEFERVNAVCQYISFFF